VLAGLRIERLLPVPDRPIESAISEAGGRRIKHEGADRLRRGLERGVLKKMEESRDSSDFAPPQNGPRTDIERFRNFRRRRAPAIRRRAWRGT